MLGSAVIAVRSPKARARMTNNLRALRGVDGRSAEGKRYRDLLDSIILEYGDVDPIRIRALAGLRYTLEKTQTAVVNGDARAREDLVQIANLIDRRERELRAKRKADEAKPINPLRAYLAGQKGAGDAR